MSMRHSRKIKPAKRLALVSLESVSAAINTINQCGGRASIRAIRKVLGGGSHATILKFVQMIRGRAYQAVATNGEGNDWFVLLGLEDLNLKAEYE